MEFSEPEDFRGAISPSTRALWVLGVGIFEYPIGHPRPILSVCWSITHIIIYLVAYCFAQQPRLTTKNGSAALVYVFYITNFCCIFMAITLMFGARKTKIITDGNRRIFSINRTLKRFGITEDYGETFKNQLLILAVGLLLFTVSATISIIVSGVNFGSINLGFVSYWISTIYKYMFIFVSGCFYCSIFWYIDNRFRHLNAYLLQLTSNERAARPSPQHLDRQMSMLLPITRETYGNLRFAKAAGQQWMTHVLRDARRVHHELCTTAKALNRAFGTQINLLVLISFCTITSLIFILYEVYGVVISTHNIGRLQFFLPSSCWLILYIMAIYYVVRCSLTVSDQAQKTGEVIYGLVMPGISSDLRNEISFFSLQLIQNPLVFTANGLFTLDYVMIRNMAGSVTTYFVIILQMRNAYGVAEVLETTSVTTFLGNSTA